jgi:hypothetical protein
MVGTQRAADSRQPSRKTERSGVQKIVGCSRYSVVVLFRQMARRQRSAGQIKQRVGYIRARQSKAQQR